MALRVVPASDVGWDAVESVFLADATSRDCWCQFHLLTNAEWHAETRESRKTLLEQQVETLDPPRGLLALDGDEPVGWTAVDPRTRMRHLLASRLVVKSSPYPLDDDRVWSVSCVMVPPAHRRRGIGAALLHGATAYARESGATAIEGYPIDVDQRGGRLPSGFSTGTLGMFAAEGFATVAALPSGRTLVHRPLAEETGR